MLHPHTPRSEGQDRIFLDAIAEGCSVGRACERAQYSRAAVYRYRLQDGVFAELWNAAKECAVERLEEEADRRALEGVPFPVLYKDQVVLTRIKYSDGLLLARLKALAPDRYVHHMPRAVVERSRTRDFAGITLPWPSECAPSLQIHSTGYGITREEYSGE